ncbi:AAA family ATPase [Rhizobium sp. G187]|uniref:AAA family ATPase n=1 Tax=Rhizobium sp. G187 TaxID=3451352 RepID=UPI003EE4B243
MNNSAAQPNGSPLEPGDEVDHEVFGRGVVVRAGQWMSSVTISDGTTPLIFNSGLKLVKPAAANDNAPQTVPATPAGLDIFAWKASRFAGEPEPVEYLVDGVIESGIPGMIAAMGEVGKSYSLLELSRRIAFGSPRYAPPIFGGQVVQEGTAVFLTGEDDQKAMHRRIASLDPDGERFTAKGDKLLVIPMPSAVGAIEPFWRQDKQRGLVPTDAWARFVGQLADIRDLRSVVIDPLQLFAAIPLNEDPAAGQFVCGQVATVAAQLKTNIFFAHHMKKSGREIQNLSDARDAVRGTTALVDGVRLAYGLWYGEQDKARKTCKTLGLEYAPNRIVMGGVIKANGAARRILSTYARNDFGLLIDKTAGLGSSAPDQGDLRAALVIAVEAAAVSGQPFTKTGATGLYAMRERLPEELKSLARHKLEGLAAEAISSGAIVLCLAGGTVAKWLDVPGGQFATGLGGFRKGMVRA